MTVVQRPKRKSVAKGKKNVKGVNQETEKMKEMYT